MRHAVSIPVMDIRKSTEKAKVDVVIGFGTGLGKQQPMHPCKVVCLLLADLSLMVQIHLVTDQHDNNIRGRQVTCFF
jgi:hypothetical protein